MDSNSCSITHTPERLVPEFYRRADALHRLTSRGARLLRSFVQNFLDRAGLRQHGPAALADRIEMRVERLRQLGLDLDVADLPGAIAFLQIVHFPGVGVEGVVVDEHGIAFDGT